MPGTDRSKRPVDRDARITCKPVANGFANSGEVFLFLGQCLERCVELLVLGCVLPG